MHLMRCAPRPLHAAVVIVFVAPRFEARRAASTTPFVVAIAPSERATGLRRLRQPCSALGNNALRATRRFAASFADINKACTLLGATVDTDPKELKGKYRELVKKHHPDTGGSEEMMKQLGIAYQTLTGLSKRDKQEYSQFGRGGAADTSSAGAAGRPRGHSKFYGNGGAQSYQTAYDYQQAYQNQRKRTYARYGAYQDPTTTTAEAYRQYQKMYNPFAAGSNAQSFEQFVNSGFGSNRLLSRGQLMTVVTMYFVLFMIVTSVYRRYTDWKQSEGWAQAERLARHEQLEELAQVRQEMRERARRQLAEVNERRRGDVSEAAKERRAYDYAQQRTLEQALRGWPAFDPALGQLMRHPADPLGIVYFEPFRPTAATAAPSATAGASAYTSTYGISRDQVRSATTVGAPPAAIQNPYRATPLPNPQQSSSTGSGTGGGESSTLHPTKRPFQPAPPLPPEDDPTRPALNWSQMTLQQKRDIMQSEEQRQAARLAERRGV